MPRFDAYELEALIARGGMADVWRARALEGPHAGRAVALKRLLPELAEKPEWREMFQREGELGTLFAHPGLVAVLDRGERDGTHFLILELVEGMDLRRFLDQAKRLSFEIPPDVAAYLVAEAADALHHAHRAPGPDGGLLGVVHCDATPANVFVSRDGEVKVGDFGVAHVAARQTRRRRQTGAFGKAPYLAPEQIRGDPVSPQTDVFGLGAIFYELLTGQAAFAGESDDDLARRAGGDTPLAPSAIRPSLKPLCDAVVRRALAPEPARRHESAGALAAELRRLWHPGFDVRSALVAVLAGLSR